MPPQKFEAQNLKSSTCTLLMRTLDDHGEFVETHQDKCTQDVQQVVGNELRMH
jgi:signal transduction histidine kinase